MVSFTVIYFLGHLGAYVVGYSMADYYRLLMKR